MSRKKYTKTDLYQELKESLEQIYEHLESAEVHYNSLEHQDYLNLVVKPLEELMDNVEVFEQNISSGIYEPEDLAEDFEE